MFVLLQRNAPWISWLQVSTDNPYINISRLEFASIAYPIRSRHHAIIEPMNNQGSSVDLLYKKRGRVWHWNANEP